MKIAFKLVILSSIIFPSALLARDFSPHEAVSKLDHKKNEIQVKYKTKQNGELSSKQGEGDSLVSDSSKAATLDQDKKDQIQAQLDRAKSSIAPTEESGNKQSKAAAVTSAVSSKVSSVVSNVSSYLVRNQ